MNIFFSYTMRDGVLSRKALQVIEERLSYLGRPYIDILHNSSWFPQTYVEKKLRSADLLVACATKGLLLSPWVQLELTTAYRSHIPVALVDYRLFLGPPSGFVSPSIARGDLFASLTIN